MKVEVKQEHIDRGERTSIYFCPIALALVSKLGCNRVSVGSETCNYNGTTFELPKEAQSFIIAFDEARPVHPFEFELKDEMKCW